MLNFPSMKHQGAVADAAQHHIRNSDIHRVMIARENRRRRAGAVAERKRE